MLEGFLLLEHERDAQQRSVVEDVERGADGVVVEVADEPAHGHVLLAAQQLARHGRNPGRGDPRDDRARAARVELDGHVGEELDRHRVRHLHGAVGVEQPGDPRCEHGSERPLADRRHDADRQQLAGGGEASQGGALSGEHQLRHLVAELAEVGGGDLLEVFELLRLAPEQPRQLEGLRPDFERAVHPRTFRTGMRRSLGMWLSARSPAAASSAACRWRASRTASVRSRS